MQAMLAQRDRDRGQLGDLVVLHGGRVETLALAEDMRAGLTALRPVLDDLVDALERKQRPACALVPGLAAPPAPRGWFGRARRRRRRILRGRQRGVARAAVEALLELADARLEPPVRLDQLAHPHEQDDRRLPLAVENRLRLGTLHADPVRRPERGPCLQK